ncbi:hypothetical protein NIASO_09960 [Niabella soli DSM 19437]|uniref:Uncharacterized protein n=1 Tax=Niabella soli DSM 19437 TaxID=929713 RepID=W0F3G0_9BACT|nr:hypothetical protein NIASO_09960 [Niabella soli DSM 19437]
MHNQYGFFFAQPVVHYKFTEKGVLVKTLEFVC